MDKATETAFDKIEDLLIQSSTPAQAPRAFELNRQHFDVGFPVNWPPLGEIKIHHRLRRPRPDEEVRYKKECVTQQRLLGGGKVSDHKVKVVAARVWLWDQICTHVKGYPGMGDDWVEVTPELRAQMRGAHKESAIRWLYECDVEVLESESVMTNSGSEWAVLLHLGERDNYYASIKVRVAEWDQRQEDKFEASQSISSSKVEGKTQLSTTAVNQRAYRDLFAATLIDVQAGPDGPHDLITVDGETFSAMNKAKFANAFLGEWQVDIMAALVQIWWGK